MLVEVITGQKVCDWKGHLEVQPLFSGHPGPSEPVTWYRAMIFLSSMRFLISPLCQPVKVPLDGSTALWLSTLPGFVSFAQLLRVPSNPISRSLMQMSNRCGLSTDPLDVPLVTGLQLDFTASPLGPAYRKSKNHKNRKSSWYVQAYYFFIEELSTQNVGWIQFMSNAYLRHVYGAVFLCTIASSASLLSPWKEFGNTCCILVRKAHLEFLDTFLQTSLFCCCCLLNPELLPHVQETL